MPRRVLPLIVFSQCAGTALWFAANAVMADLQHVWALPTTAAGTLSMAVQFGFVSGTLVFALLMTKDEAATGWRWSLIQSSSLWPTISNCTRSAQ